jgi:hypothetical protein
MSEAVSLSRRMFLGGASAAALLPAPLAAQAAGPNPLEFAAACRALSGFDTVPEALVTGAWEVMSREQRADVVDGRAGDDLKKSLLKRLYTGMATLPEGPPERFAYSEALMFAAVEESLNVPSYCGGVPGYWSEKPDDARTGPR